MKANKKRSPIAIIIVLAAVIAVMIIGAVTTNADTVKETFWALVPPLIAIVMAMVTKEVYSSLFVGIVAGALLYTGFKPLASLHVVFEDGILGSLSDTGNLALIIWPVFLGVVVVLLNKAHASAAFSAWAKKHIKTRTGAQICTICLGILIFIDDYFNCLTVGSVMRPVTDKHNISRSKLAYIIDATAAPICIIAPVSSWAAAVAGLVEGEDGFSLFLRAIPFNFYALLTIVFLFALVIIKGAEYGPMARHELNAENGDIYTSEAGMYSTDEEEKDNDNKNSKVRDLIIPIVALIVFCVAGMLYTGDFFAGASFVDAFANCNASLGLLFGAFFGMVFTMIYMVCRRLLTFKQCMDGLPEGFRLMAPAIIILVLAWALKTMTSCLGAKEFVAGLIEGSAAGLLGALPAVIFLIACGLAFASGTSWGTFGILIPLVAAAFQSVDPTLMVIGISACLAGSVCGDHCSPISDTTIMSSAGAQCNHINHVSTQLPYAATVAGISCISFLIAGYTRSWILSLVVGIVLVIAILLFVKSRNKKKAMNK